MIRSSFFVFFALFANISLGMQDQHLDKSNDLYPPTKSGEDEELSKPGAFNTGFSQKAPNSNSQSPGKHVRSESSNEGIDNPSKKQRSSKDTQDRLMTWSQFPGVNAAPDFPISQAPSVQPPFFTPYQPFMYPTNSVGLQIVQSPIIVPVPHSVTTQIPQGQQQLLLPVRASTDSQKGQSQATKFDVKALEKEMKGMAKRIDELTGDSLEEFVYERKLGHINNETRDHIISVLANSLESNTNLKALKLSSFRYNEIGSIFVALMKSSTITDLNLSGNKQIDTEKMGGRSLVQLLTHNSFITNLNLSNCNIHAPTQKAMLNALAQNGSLKCFVLGVNDFDAFDELSAALEENTVLNSLDIANGIHPRDQKERDNGEIARAIAKNSSLTTLYLRTIIGFDSITHILGNNTTLKELGIYAKKLTKANLAEIETAIEKTSTLKVLIINYYWPDESLFDSISWKGIFEAHKKNKSIRKLSFDHLTSEIKLPDIDKTNSAIEKYKPVVNHRIFELHLCCQEYPLDVVMVIEEILRPLIYDLFRL